MLLLMISGHLSDPQQWKELGQVQTNHWAIWASEIKDVIIDDIRSSEWKCNGRSYGMFVYRENIWQGV